MRHKIFMELEFESDFIGFGEVEDMDDLGLIKYLIEEEGFHGIIEVTNSEMAEGIKEIKKLSEWFLLLLIMCCWIANNIESR